MNAFRQRQGIFYGWVVVAATFTLTFVGFGSAYTFSAFIEVLQQDLGASRGSVSLVFSLAGFLYFALGVISGPLADRFGARSLCLVGMVLVGFGLALAGQARTIAEVYAAYGLGIGLGVGCAYVPALGAVQRWFVARRGLASGLAVSGIGLGTLVMPPLATWLIAAFGWREAYLMLGGAAAVFGIGAALLLENDPGRRGLRPDGVFVEPGVVNSAAKEGVSVKDAIRTRQFVGMYVACLLSAVGVFVPFVHLVPFAVDHQIAPTVAVLLLSAIGVGSTAGRFCLGGACRSFGSRHFPGGNVRGHRRVACGLGLCDRAFGPCCLRSVVRIVLRWLGRGAAGRGCRSFRPPQCGRDHRASLHERRNRHADRPGPRRLYLRRQPQLLPGHCDQRRRQRGGRACGDRDHRSQIKNGCGRALNWRCSFFVRFAIGYRCHAFALLAINC